MRGIISTNDGLVESAKLSFSLGKWISFWLRYILSTSIWFCIGKLLNGLLLSSLKSIVKFEFTIAVCLIDLLTALDWKMLSTKEKSLWEL